MIKIFTTDKDGKITLTKQELQDIVNEAYWEGYNQRSSYTTITSSSWPLYTWKNDNTLRATLTNTTEGAIYNKENKNND